MRKKMLLSILLLILICFLCGCDFWMDGNHFSVTPHVEDSGQPIQTSKEIKSYQDLCFALENLVENGKNNAVLYISGFNEEQIRGYMNLAIRYLQDEHAIGSFAMDEVTYEIGTNAGRQAIAINIDYNRTRSEILRIKQAGKMDDVTGLVFSALNKCEPNVIVKVSGYQAIDFTQLVQDYVDENPQVCMEMPQVAVGTYPDRGKERVLEITFTYQTSRDVLRDMQDMVKPVFSSAELYVSGNAENAEKYVQLYSFLMERYDYQIETSITPSYSLLRHGVGDSKAFAVVYSAMCRQAGLDCRLVSGTKDGIAWYWNAILQDGRYYYIDLIQCNVGGGFVAKPEEEMVGYVWDYSAFVGEPGHDSHPDDVTEPDYTTVPEDTTVPDNTTIPEDTAVSDGTTLPEDVTEPDTITEHGNTSETISVSEPTITE